MKINTMHILVAALIISASVFAVAIVGFILGSKFLTTYEKRVNDQARYECAQSSRVQVQESETILGDYPSQAYEDCLAEKGL